MPLLLELINLICGIWVILQVYKRTDKASEQKLIWIVGSIFLGIATAIAYYILEVKDKNTNV